MGRFAFRQQDALLAGESGARRKTARMGACHKLSGAVLALGLFAVLPAEWAAGAPAADRLRVDVAGPELDGSAVMLAQTGRRANSPPSVFQGMMVPGLRRERDCRSAEQVHDRLKRQGWWDFNDLERDGEHFTVRARRPNGTAYQLTIDGCSGRVLGAMRLDGGQRGYRLWPR